MYKKLIIGVSASFILIACGGGSGTSYSNETQVDARSNKIVKMQKGKKYTINSGDTIHKLSDNTRIKAIGNRQNDTTTVELLYGKAEIDRE